MVENNRLIPNHQFCFRQRHSTWHKHIFAKRKQLGITLTKMYWLLGRKSKLYKQQTSHI
jgi:hypothetical protein